MKRRNFLVGVGGTAVGASALVGSGAFSRVESDRAVNIEVAKDGDAYLGMSPGPTANGDNYADFDDNGHIEIDIGHSGEGDGDGVNSNSTTWFDGLVKLCNQGKDDASIFVDTSDLDFKDNAEMAFYVQYPDENGNFVPGSERHLLADLIEDGDNELLLGNCVFVGIKTMTYDVDAKGEGPLVNGDVTVIADVDGEE